MCGGGGADKKNVDGDDDHGEMLIIVPLSHLRGSTSQFQMDYLNLLLIRILPWTLEHGNGDSKWLRWRILFRMGPRNGWLVGSEFR